MEAEHDNVPSIIDADAPIDFEALKKEVAANGPLCVSKKSSPYKVLLTPTPCRCSDQGCKAELVMVSRKHGLFEMQWVLSKADFLEFPSISDFCAYAISGELQDSRGERMIIEAHIERVSRELDGAEHKFSCLCPECLATQIGEDTRNIAMISQLEDLLADRNELLREAREWDEQNSETDIENTEALDVEEGRLEDWVVGAFELGYSLGRNFSEYSGKTNIEPLALLGVEAKSIKEKRQVAAGEKSRELREKRRSNLFAHMEALAIRNPDIAKLLDPDDVAKLALKKCKEENAEMWKQGPGQVTEYLGEIKRGDAGLDMQKRYKALFGNKPLRRFKGLGQTT